MAHGSRPDHSGVLDALLGALRSVDEQHAALYSDVVLATLPGAARRYLEELMSAGTYEYQSDLVRRYRAEGQADGQAEAVVAVLEARGVDVSTDARRRIIECRDLDQLAAWLRTAATADSTQALFD